MVRDKEHKTAGAAVRAIKAEADQPKPSKPSGKPRKGATSAPKSESAGDLPPLPSLGGKPPLGPPRLVKTPGAEGGASGSQVPAKGQEPPSGDGSALPPPPAQGLPPEVENPPNAELAHWPAELLAPETVVTACREIMGTIDLDPCSSEHGQERVGAKAWFGTDDRPLAEAWKGNVFLFPPAKLFKEFAGKLLQELDGPRVPSASFVANFDLSQRWPGALPGPSFVPGHRHLEEGGRLRRERPLAQVARTFAPGRLHLRHRGHGVAAGAGVRVLGPGARVRSR